VLHTQRWRMYQRERLADIVRCLLLCIILKVAFDGVHTSESSEIIEMLRVRICLFFPSITVKHAERPKEDSPSPKVQLFITPPIPPREQFCLFVSSFLSHVYRVSNRHDQEECYLSSHASLSTDLRPPSPQTHSHLTSSD
jgi:hypothetical protein